MKKIKANKSWAIQKRWNKNYAVKPQPLRVYLPYMGMPVYKLEFCMKAQMY